MGSWFRLMLVGVALVAGVVVTVLVSGGGDETAANKPEPKAAKGKLPPIQGLQMQVEGLIYNVTDVRILDYDSPSAAPYLTNLQRPAKGGAFLGVFMRVYNPTGKDLASAPGYLLE